MTLLTVSDLVVEAAGQQIIRGLSLSVDAGERVGLIGESGSGKTMAALALMGLLPEGLSLQGSIELEGVELTGLSDRRYSEIRGDRLAMIFQEPMTALDPLMRVGRQIRDAVRLHRRISRAEASSRMLQLLARVGFRNPTEQARRFPHQLSGGQRQRVLIAIALACDPALILADEPTTALDVTVQAQVLSLLQRLVREERSALLLISHDLAVVSSVCDRVLVMYGGTVVESAPTREILTAPRHPYTVALLDTSRGISADGETAAGQLPTIPGAVPAWDQFPSGCVFRGRCPREQDRCREVPSLTEGEHRVACWFPISSDRGGGS
ncbi:MAG: ABC transporter ATP-binding protein [Candidatus Dormiibacterota bacterium]